jgi:hypothetical protein
MDSSGLWSVMSFCGASNLELSMDVLVVDMKRFGHGQPSYWEVGK